MKISELVILMNQAKNKVIKAEQKQELLKKTIEVKSYLSIKDKKRLVQDIVDECIIYEDGIFKFDEIEKYICFTMRTIAAYTNLELSEDMEDDYDMLCESQLLNAIIESFRGEYDNVKVLLQMKCDYILCDNALETQVSKFLNDTLDKIGTLVNVLMNKIDDFNLGDLSINKDTLGMLMNAIKLQK